jgi:hypothetical protein
MYTHHSLFLTKTPHPALAILEGPVFRALLLSSSPAQGGAGAAAGGGAAAADTDVLLALWPHLRVLARCTPADKHTLVQVHAHMRPGQEWWQPQGCIRGAAGDVL